MGRLSSHWSDFSSVTKVRQNITQGKTKHIREIKKNFCRRRHSEYRNAPKVVDDREEWLYNLILHLFVLRLPRYDAPMYIIYTHTEINSGDYSVGHSGSFTFSADSTLSAVVVKFYVRKRKNQIILQRQRSPPRPCVTL